MDNSSLPFKSAHYRIPGSVSTDLYCRSCAPIPSSQGPDPGGHLKDGKAEFHEAPTRKTPLQIPAARAGGGSSNPKLLVYNDLVQT
jgi:hypothetical protein